MTASHSIYFILRDASVFFLFTQIVCLQVPLGVIKYVNIDKVTDVEMVTLI